MQLGRLRIASHHAPFGPPSVLVKRPWILPLCFVLLVVHLGSCVAVGGRLLYFTEPMEEPEVHFFMGSRTDFAFMIGEGPSGAFFERVGGMLDFPASLCVDVACLPIEAVVWLFIRPRGDAAPLGDAADDASRRR